MFFVSLRYFRIAVLFILGVLSFRASATHIVGGEVTYRVVDSTATGGYRYRFCLSIYEDCLNGTPWAIASDSIAFYAVYNGANSLIVFDSIAYNTSESVPANFTSECVNNPPELCLLKKTFYMDVVLPPDPTGYIFEYQRCCRNASIINIVDPANVGGIYYCYIPPSGVAATNNSALFKNYPPQIICVNNPLAYDHSATDADGDSLSYELCNSYSCPNGAGADVPPGPPPFPEVQYVSPFTYAMPMTAFPAFAIDAKTGVITGTPNFVGRYLVTVCCNEWRHGVLINTVKREFQFVVTACSRTVVADIPVHTSFPNVYELDCQDYTVHFENTSIGGSVWNWDFGVPGTATGHAFDPTFTYPDTGTYTVTLTVNPGEPCKDQIQRQVMVYPPFSTAFTYSGNKCTSLPITFTDMSSNVIAPPNDWKWYFGDGDTSLDQNPTHVFSHAGTYNVLLVSGNEKGCRDTALHQVIIQNFHADAGDDTIIVKGETLDLDAQGGVVYTWAPNPALSQTNVSNPVAYLPNAGQYEFDVYVESAFGCAGNASIRVGVVNDASFIMPTAFSPNGDGLNDVFRPRAIGFKGLKYFRVFNRFGEEVYYGTSLEDGWDGKYKGIGAEMGVYFWSLAYTDRFGKAGMMKGDVTLVR